MGLVGERDLDFVLSITITINTMLIAVFWGYSLMRYSGSYGGYLCSSSY
jgi:hypothetical protein